MCGNIPWIFHIYIAGSITHLLSGTHPQVVCLSEFYEAKNETCSIQGISRYKATVIIWCSFGFFRQLDASSQFSLVTINSTTSVHNNDLYKWYSHGHLAVGQKDSLSAHRVYPSYPTNCKQISTLLRNACRMLLIWGSSKLLHGHYRLIQYGNSYPTKKARLALL